MLDPRSLLKHLFDAAVAAADPYQALAPYIAKLSRPKGRVVVIGTGKGSAQMAVALEKLWQEAELGALSGAVVTSYGYGAPCQTIDVLEASHPVPDQASLTAATRLKGEVAGLGPDDLVIALICGGGSALLAAPAPGLTLEDEIALNQLLLASGAPIRAMNAIRKQISTIKGGRLAQLAAPARLISFIVSDIPGDDPALVSSGPTVADASSFDEACAAIRHYHLDLPPRLKDFFDQGGMQESRPNKDERLAGEVHMVACAAHSLKAAQRYSEKFGLKSVILSDAIEGESRDIAFMHGAIAREIVLHHQPFNSPIVLLSGGETTVTLDFGQKGSGGRNSEFALSLALAIEGYDMITALAADTDGIDGASTNAGAFCDGQTVLRLRTLGFDPRAALAAHDSGHVLAQIGNSFTTGPTGTNVNDFRAIVIA